MRKPFILAWFIVFNLLPSGFGTPNVLFIAVDDLRPALGCYGDTIAVTPNIDRLANRGTVFKNAYCQMAVCGPSRLSVLSGRRPDTIEVWDLDTHFRDAKPEIVSLPQLFKNNGYYTRSIGKIYHGSGPPSKDPPSWSEAPIYDYVREVELRYALKENLEGSGLKRNASESAEVPDNHFVDGRVCERALEALDELTEKGMPFFLAVGFRKPHLPFVAPKKYWDLYRREDITEPASTTHPAKAPEYATRSWHELEGYRDIPEPLNRLEVDKIRELRHGYYACISYVDSLIGRLLDRLEENGLDQNTIVCLWSDHGFHLGEQGLWTKANNYELSNRVPLIFASPFQLAKGASCESWVELVDLYPTLAEVCGLETDRGLEGISFKPLLDDPEREWKSAVFHQYPRMYSGFRHKKSGEVMGYAVRTRSFRYVEWLDLKSGEVSARELYDHRKDAEEMSNVVENPEYKQTLNRLQVLLKEGWRSALPED